MGEGRVEIEAEWAPQKREERQAGSAQLWNSHSSQNRGLNGPPVQRDQAQSRDRSARDAVHNLKSQVRPSQAE